jgi:hypothetical protein
MALIRLTALAMMAGAMLAGCGGGGSGSTTTGATHSASSAGTAAVPTAAPFAWLRPASAPSGWSVARLPSGTAMAYPSSWQRIRSDPGTVSAAVVEPGSDLVVDYMNATPQQGEETLRNWATFRPDHDREEGDSQVRVLASARGLRFRDGRGSCVIDRYRTPRTSYQEIACLVSGRHGANVIVAAALASRWRQEAPVLERAVSAFVA